MLSQEAGEEGQASWAWVGSERPAGRGGDSGPSTAASEHPSTEHSTHIVCCLTNDSGCSPPSRSSLSPNPASTTIESNFPAITLANVLDAVGDSGAYQRTIVITSMLCLFGSAFVAFSVSFLVAEPSFLCELKYQAGTWVECTEAFACTDPTSRPIFKFSSWAEKLGLICEKRLLRETGKSLSLLVNALVCFLTLNLSDFLGRRTMLITNSVLLLLSLALAFAATDFYLKMAFIGAAFGTQGAFSSLFIFLINEVSRKQTLANVRPSFASQIQDFCVLFGFVQSRNRGIEWYYSVV
jgi:hypothetical protein